MLLLPVVSGWGCASTSSAPAPDPWRQAEQALAARGLTLEEVRRPVVLTEEMEDWVHRQVRAQGSSVGMLQALLLEIQDPGGLGVRYEAGYTATAAEVFASRRANCLAFTHLFVGMAREMGLEAYYLRVDELERYVKEGDFVVHSGHVTAGYGPEHDRRVLEFSVGHQVDYRRATHLSDLRALALHYSNRGSELLRLGEIEPALRQLDIAVAVDPELADAWVNLGVARRRTGSIAGAESAYRRAVEADPDFLPAYSNLAGILRLKGEESAASELLRLLDRRDNRNPYTYVALGDASLDLGELEEARRFYRRAVRLDGANAESRAAMGGWALAAGELQEARRWLQKGERIDPQNPRIELLAQRLASAGDQG